MVLLEEFGECNPELWAEACSNLNLVVWIIEVDTNIVEFVKIDMNLAIAL